MDLKEFIMTLSEEYKYHESVLEHYKSLESTLWGLEEQASMSENSSKNDQESLSDEINNCRKKISSCKKLLSSHDKKMLEYINTFRQVEEMPCSGCK